MLCIVAEMNSRPRAAGAAVLIPCHSGPAELLPEGVSANELLPGALLCTKLDDCRHMHWSAASSDAQVNELATAVVGFMIHGDAMLTYSRGLAVDLLSEVQASLNHLSAFHMPSATPPNPGRQGHQPDGLTARTRLPAKTTTVAAVSPAQQVHTALRHRRHTPSPVQVELLHSTETITKHSKPNVNKLATSVDQFELFQAPDLPGLEQSMAVTSQAGTHAERPCLVDTWGSMQAELLSSILQQLQWTSREAIALTGVCRSWRRVITSDQQFLKSVLVKVNPKSPLHGNQHLCECCRGMSAMVQQARHRQMPLPRVIDKAAHSGSISASVCVAQIMDARGDTAAALKFWGKAAKLGHPEAQFRLGRACYEGVGLAPDAQDALLWLGRATKTLLAEDLNVESIANVSTASLLARRNQMHHDRQQGIVGTSFQTEFSMSEEQVLAKAALLLGFLHLDGEATKFDAAEALKWFKVALLNDCAEAERIIGTLFNTGQYG